MSHSVSNCHKRIKSEAKRCHLLKILKLKCVNVLYFLVCWQECGCIFYPKIPFHITDALPGEGGGPISPVGILKLLVSVFINAFRLLSALPSLLQFRQGRLSLNGISFYALSPLFGPCCLSEFTLAGPHNTLTAFPHSTPMMCHPVMLFHCSFTHWISNRRTWNWGFVYIIFICILRRGMKVYEWKAILFILKVKTCKCYFIVNNSTMNMIAFPQE